MIVTYINTHLLCLQLLATFYTILRLEEQGLEDAKEALTSKQSTPSADTT